MAQLNLLLQVCPTPSQPVACASAAWSISHYPAVVPAPQEILPKEVPDMSGGNRQWCVNTLPKGFTGIPSWLRIEGFFCFFSGNGWRFDIFDVPPKYVSKFVFCSVRLLFGTRVSWCSMVASIHEPDKKYMTMFSFFKAGFIGLNCIEMLKCVGFCVVSLVCLHYNSCSFRFFE